MPAPQPETDQELARLYARELIRFASEIPRLGRLENPDGSAHRESRLCGSQITVDLCIENNRVTDYAQQVDASALGDAAASILARHIIDCDISELRDLLDVMEKMLTADGPPPEDKWADLALFTSVIGYRARYPSVLLPFQAVVAAVEDYQSRQ